MSVAVKPPPLPSSRMRGAPSMSMAYADRMDDPLSLALRPPANETADQRAVRVRAQLEAKEVSRMIDQRILEDKKILDRRRNAVKILLLGQAESGKSTTLKNFQLAFCPTHFRTERVAWRAVIQLNLIKSIKTLLDIIQEELDSYATPVVPRTGSVRGSATGRPSTSSTVHTPLTPTSPGPNQLTDEHRRLRMRLSPLVSIEQVLVRKLLPSMQENLEPRSWSYPVQDTTVHLSDGPIPVRPIRATPGDICVRAGSSWKIILAKATSPPPGAISPTTSSSDHSAELKGKKPMRPATADIRNRDDPTSALSASLDDIVRLWEDPVLKAVVKKRGLRMESTPGFFLNDAARVASLDYEPSDDDILRARIRTLGVEEHQFHMESGKNAGHDWYIYDVGGSRTTRDKWVPYFDDVQAIIFLAPLAFNLFLDEDPTVNRLEDSMLLWKSVCSNRLLERATLILFLNKMDVLAATLAEGVHVSWFVPKFGDQPNDVPTVTAYFKERFVGYHKRFSTTSRQLYVHETSAIDAAATQAILRGVQEGILLAHLKTVDLI